jgi:hypothetical protein
MADTTENEPLLGAPGTGVQGDDKPIWHNLFLGLFSVNDAYK